MDSRALIEIEKHLNAVLFLLDAEEPDAAPPETPPEDAPPGKDEPEEAPPEDAPPPPPDPDAEKQAKDDEKKSGAKQTTKGLATAFSQILKSARGRKGYKSVNLSGDDAPKAYYGGGAKNFYKDFAKRVRFVSPEKTIDVVLVRDAKRIKKGTFDFVKSDPDKQNIKKDLGLTANDPVALLVVDTTNMANTKTLGHMKVDDAGAFSPDKVAQLKAALKSVFDKKKK